MQGKGKGKLLRQCHNKWPLVKSAIPSPDDKCRCVDAPEGERLDGLILCGEEHALQCVVQLRVAVKVKPVVTVLWCLCDACDFAANLSDGPQSPEAIRCPLLRAHKPLLLPFRGNQRVGPKGWLPDALGATVINQLQYTSTCDCFQPTKCYRQARG